MPIRTIAYCIGVLLAISVTGCRKGLSSPSVPESGGIYISIVVSAEGASVAESPAPGEDGVYPESGTGAENTVNDLNVYFFEGDTAPEGGVRPGLNSSDGNTPVRHLHVGREQLVLQSGGTTHGAVYVATEDVSGLLEAGKTYDVAVIANAGEAVTGVEYLSDLRDKVFGGSDIVKYDNSRQEKVRSIMMASAGPASFTIRPDNDSPAKAASVNVEIERMAARVNISGGRYNDVIVTTDKGVRRDQVRLGYYFIVNNYSAGSYAFKRVTKDLEGDEVEYLGKERTDIADNNTYGSVLNYVVDPKTLTPSSVTSESYTNYFQDISPGQIAGILKEFQVSHETEISALSYVYENVVRNDVLNESTLNQYSTGIVFRADYEPDGFEYGDSFYWYNNTAYKTPSEIGIDGVTEENFEDYGIRYYEGGVCYYTYWIRHVDDGDDSRTGPMEFAIVRNNVYSVNVTGVSGIGTPQPSDYGRASAAMLRTSIR